MFTFLVKLQFSTTDNLAPPTFQYSSVNESEDKATWEMDEDSTIIETNKLPEVINLKL